MPNSCLDPIATRLPRDDPKHLSHWWPEAAMGWYPRIDLKDAGGFCCEWYIYICIHRSGMYHHLFVIYTFNDSVLYVLFILCFIWLTQTAIQGTWSREDGRYYDGPLRRLDHLQLIQSWFEKRHHELHDLVAFLKIHSPNQRTSIYKIWYTQIYIYIYTYININIHIYIYII